MGYEPRRLPLHHFHITGEDNCWVDLLSRWGAKHSKQESSLFVQMSLSSLFTAPVAPELDPEFTWPNTVAPHDCTKRSHGDWGRYHTDTEELLPAQE